MRHNAKPCKCNGRYYALGCKIYDVGRVRVYHCTVCKAFWRTIELTLTPEQYEKLSSSWQRLKTNANRKTKRNNRKETT